MSKNVGRIDRIIRIVVGLAILSPIVFLEHSLRWVGLIGVVPLLTGLAGWCSAYTLFRLSSDTRKPHKPA